MLFDVDGERGEEAGRVYLTVNARGVNLTKPTSRECRQHAFDFEIVVNVGARACLY